MLKGQEKGDDGEQKREGLTQMQLGSCILHYLEFTTSLNPTGLLWY